MVGKEQKIRLENIESRPRVHHFYVVFYFRAVTSGYDRLRAVYRRFKCQWDKFIYIYTFHR